MTPHQEDKLVMYGSVIAFEKRYTETLAVIPALASAFGKFAAAVELVKEKSKRKEEVVAGKYESKESAKTAFVTALAAATGRLPAHARKNNLEDMKKLTYKVTRASLNKLNQTDFDQKAGILLDLLEVNKTNLAEYGISELKIAQVKSCAGLFHEAKAAHKGGSAEKSSANMAMDEAFATADDILKGDIDRMMEIPREENPDMYNEYISSRVIKDLSGTKKGNGGTATTSPPAQ